MNSEVRHWEQTTGSYKSAGCKKHYCSFAPLITSWCMFSPLFSCFPHNCTYLQQLYTSIINLDNITNDLYYHHFFAITIAGGSLFTANQASQKASSYATAGMILKCTSKSTNAANYTLCHRKAATLHLAQWKENLQLILHLQCVYLHQYHFVYLEKKTTKFGDNDNLVPTFWPGCTGLLYP